MELVRVNGSKPKKGHLLTGGEIVEILHTPEPETLCLLPNPSLPLKVLFEDEFLLAVSKEPGLPTLPRRKEDTHSLLNALLAHYPDQAEVNPEKGEGGILHRLDNATSGIVLVAKTGEVWQKLWQIQKEGGMLKEYLAWVWGSVAGPGQVETPIAHHPKNPAKMVLDESRGRPASTHYELLKSHGEFSLLKVGLKKGLRHQIRLHLAGIGHSIVGDTLYGSDQDREFPRLYLHASRIYFRHPVTQSKMDLLDPAPEGFRPSRKNLPNPTASP